MDIDYTALNGRIKNGDIKIAKTCIRIWIARLNKQQAAYKNILSVDYEVCLHKFYLTDGVVIYNPVQGRLKMNSFKLSALYSALNILDNKPCNHIPSCRGEALGDVFPLLYKIFGFTDYEDAVKELGRSRKYATK